MNDVTAGFLVALERQQAPRRCLFQKAVEGAKRVIALVEARPAALQRLLHHRAPYLFVFAALGDQGVNGGEDEIKSFLLLVLVFFFFLVFVLVLLLAVS